MLRRTVSRETFFCFACASPGGGKERPAECLRGVAAGSAKRFHVKQGFRIAPALRPAFRLAFRLCAGWLPGVSDIWSGSDFLASPLLWRNYNLRTVAVEGDAAATPRGLGNPDSVDPSTIRTGPGTCLALRWQANGGCCPARPRWAADAPTVRRRQLPLVLLRLDRGIGVP